jgi:hypothetical protein
MDRRKAMKITSGAIIGCGAGILALTNGFKPKYLPPEEPKKAEFKNISSSWSYDPLDPDITADVAYKNYDNGGCMYATFMSIISQLADKFGEPYASFPTHMMKYGHGGVGGFGTICGSLNGASALIGLLVADKAAQDILITDLLRWYEKAKLPEYQPKIAIHEFTPASTVSNSTLCHVSNTRWVKETGYKINSEERKERCRRLLSDVVYRVTTALNEYHGNNYVTNGNDNETVRQCLTCHGDKGKLVNINSKMGCTSCHTKSIGHRLFADLHYKIMKPK